MKRVIGIGGKAGHGKDIAAGYILAVYPEARRVAFADELKLQALEAWPEIETHPYKPYLHLLTDERKLDIATNLKANVAFRTFLQEFGQGKRDEDPEYWIRQCFDRHERLHGWDHPLVIPDVRHLNELAAVLQARGMAFRVHRPGYENHLTPEQRAHPSETALDEFDWHHVSYTGIVENPGEPVEFLKRVLDATRWYLHPQSYIGGV
jgi:PAS domain-containing protein